MTSLKNAVGLSIALYLGAQSASAQFGGAGGSGPDAGMPYEPVTVIAPNISIPTNGVILIYAEDRKPTVEVRKLGAAVVVDGSVRQSGSGLSTEWVWIPSEELTPGGYEVTVDNEVSTSTERIVVVEAVDLEHMPLPQMPRAERVAFQSEPAACVGWRNGQVFPSTWFDTVESARIEVRSGLDPSVAPEVAHQFLYSFAMADTRYQWEHDPSLLWNGPFRFETQSESYCVRFFVQRLIDLEELSMELCAPHGDLPSLDAEALEIPDSQLERSRCPGAPAGFEVQWCEVNRACDSITTRAELEESNCELYGPICRNECLPDGTAIRAAMINGGGGGGTTTAPWSGGSGNGPCVPVEADEPADELDLSNDIKLTNDERGGCGCSTIGSTRPAYAWLALSFVAIATLRLRRRLHIPL